MADVNEIDVYNFGGALMVHLSDFEELEARLAELEKDAARYRLVRRLVTPDSLLALYCDDDCAEEYNRAVDSAVDELLSREA